MRIEIFSDVVCPWCYIGRHRFARAVEAFEAAGHARPEVTWRAYQLDPTAPTEPEPVLDHYRRRWGREGAAAAFERVAGAARGEGLALRLDRARRANTHDAHRLIAWSADAARRLALPDPAGVQTRVVDGLFRAYFVDGADVADAAVLAGIAAEAGLPAADATEMLAGSDHASAVAGDVALAGELGLTGVPFFVIDRRVAIPGAQDPDTFLAVMQKAERLHAGARPGEPPEDAAGPGSEVIAESLVAPPAAAPARR